MQNWTVPGKLPQQTSLNLAVHKVLIQMILSLSIEGLRKF